MTCASRRAQRGGVMVMVALSLLVLIGMMGLAVDTGRLYVAKTELQNAADACALAAARELAGALAPDAQARASAAGVAVGRQHKVDFQTRSLAAANFSLSYETGQSTPPANRVRCEVSLPSLKPWVLQVVGVGTQALAATATAGLVRGQAGSVLPLALCSSPAALVRGEWFTLRTELVSAGDPTVYRYDGGQLRWVDFAPQTASTTGCAVGEPKLACQLAGTGAWVEPLTQSGTCASQGFATPSSGCVALTTDIRKVEDAYNSRFGLYRGSYSKATAPPDVTGHVFVAGNGPNAYDAPAGGGTSFRAARQSHLPNASGAAGYTAISSAEHLAAGADRRLVTVPVVDCTGFDAGGSVLPHAPVRSYACLLLLNTAQASTSLGGRPVASLQVEYLGAANDATSPCATWGTAGAGAAAQLAVPALLL